ncbi:YIP1 family protein [Phototrophicus methaneseepsis]|uniref:YIP1 family protein n=1 Tax=Phototrophicus methaneseepsis TaxID=2710758 RepID=A0A7S8EAT0_9CHLR|nr:YIP1 family protein [Phototrophicus methaneseepsis]QPC83507.1 YIP1 family protein [Phototrophicus methaneseepsis]
MQEPVHPQRPEPQKPKPPQPARYSWAEVWTAVLTKPSVATFKEILNDPQATVRRALIWVYLGALATSGAFMISIISDPELMGALTSAPEFTGMDVEGALRGAMLFAVPVASIFALLIFLGMIGIMHGIARQFPPKSQAPFREIAYTVGAIYAPLNIISIFFMLIPVLGVFGLFVTVYQLYLMWLAVRAVYDLDARNATVAVAVPMIAQFLLALFLV